MRFRKPVFLAILMAALTASKQQNLPAAQQEPCAGGDSCAAGDSCGEGCGELAALESSWQVMDVHALFDRVAGDKPFLGEMCSGKAGDLSYSAGGEVRYRFMDESNRLRPGGPGQSSYDLWRITPFVSANYNNFIGGYVQAIDASMFGLDAPYSPTPIDVNRSDLLQMYGELNLGDVGDGTVKYRYGRQFLQYGGQRLLSSLGWANTYRNFEGHKLMYSGEDWDIDGFVMQSVNAAAGNSLHPRDADHADQSRWISGIYSTYKGIENNTLDLYYLQLNETDPSPMLMDGRRHTLGTRLAGKQPIKNGKTLVGTWNWDLEGAWQFGQDDFGSAVRRDVQAGMVGALAGYTFEDVTWKPGLGTIFYWGSGDSDPTTGEVNTFTSLYPLGHAYWGQIDNFSGQNLLDYGVQGTLKPHEKLAVVGQWHYFDLAQSSDRIYNIAGAGLTGSGDRNVGNELDLVGTWTHSKSFNVQLGWLWFFYGDAVNNGPLARPDAEQLYLQATYSF